MHSPKIMYTTAELLNLKAKAYIVKMDTDICNHIKELKNKMKFQKEKRRDKNMLKNLEQ